eukprot:TRINITY_DN23627_c0_g2_i12.p1 TRINITY_DN23627_c0_g2~~TRINITY_DN23627_c0_g2_i12.p1  ORF type:complete len:453 (-),score=31.30 TRINITY_DN23627_c0_g2_i12:396-1694(-)
MATVAMEPLLEREAASFTGLRRRSRSDVSARSHHADHDERTHTGRLVHDVSVVVLPDTDEGASVASCCSNLILSIVGVGSLTLPWAFVLIGWAQAVLLLIFFLFVSVYSLILLDGACRKMPASRDAASYAGVVSYVLGTRGAYMLEAQLLVYSLGLTISYLGVIGNELSVIALRIALHTDPSRLDDLLFKPSVLMVLAALGCILPLSMLPDDVAMRYAGAVGTFCILFTTVVIVVSAPWSSEWPFFESCGRSAQPEEPVVWKTSFSGLLSAFPLFSLCLNGAMAFVPIRAQLRACGQPVRSKVLGLVWSSEIGSCINYAVVGVVGYFSYCSAAPDNILDAYPLRHDLALVARLALALQLTAACAGVYLPLSLTSAVCTTAMMFVFPGLIAYKLEDRRGSSLARRAAPLGFALFGVFVGAACTATLLMQAAGA